MRAPSASTSAAARTAKTFSLSQLPTSPALPPCAATRASRTRGFRTAAAIARRLYRSWRQGLRGCHHWYHVQDRHPPRDQRFDQEEDQRAAAAAGRRQGRCRHGRRGAAGGPAGCGQNDEAIEQLDRVHSWATKFITNPKQRCIGHGVYADPIRPSSDAPDACTVDWAVIQLNKDAFDLVDFKGNKVYIGTSPLPPGPMIPVY